MKLRALSYLLVFLGQNNYSSRMDDFITSLETSSGDKEQKMFVKELEVGDLVWAKLRSLPYWPAKIVPPLETDSPRKSEHYVCFFGSENHAWILDKDIVRHSEDMVTFSKKKRASVVFLNAIEEIIKAALENSKPNVMLESPDVVNSDNLSKLSIVPEPKKKVRKIKNSLVKAPKKRLNNENSDDSLLSPASKVSKLVKTSSAVSSGPINANDSGVAVIASSDTSSIVSPKYTDCSSISLDIDTDSEDVSVVHVKPTDKKIGFLGLGMISRGIVKNLLNSGHQVIVWNKNPGICDDFVKAGATKALVPSSVVEAADIIFCCVSDSEAVRTVVFGPSGVIHGLKDSTKQKGYVEMSSIDAETAKHVAEVIKVHGGKYLEAPVMGDRQLAGDGNLLVLASGDVSLFKDCETCFHAISKNALFISPKVGEGSKYNLILSMLTGTVCGALAEALTLAKCLRVSQEEVMKVFQNSGLVPAMVLEKGHAIVDQNFSPSTSLKHQQKNIDLALCMSDDVMQSMPVSAAANELYKHARLLGYSDNDVAAVYQGAKY